MKAAKSIAGTLIHPPVPQGGEFDFQISGAGALAPMAAAVLLLGVPAATLMGWIEEGRMRWAFDIRRQKAGRAEVRIPRQCLLECAGLAAKPSATLSAEEDFRRVADAILPKGFLLNPSTVSAGNAALKKITRTAPPAGGATNAIQRLLYPQEPVLLGSDVAIFLSCSGDHVGRLVAEGSLKTANFRRGPRSTPLIFRHSILQFLKARRIV